MSQSSYSSIIVTECFHKLGTWDLKKFNKYSCPQKFTASANQNQKEKTTGFAVKINIAGKMPKKTHLWKYLVHLCFKV